jgi:hypothetical protein
MRFNRIEGDCHQSTLFLLSAGLPTLPLTIKRFRIRSVSITAIDQNTYKN